MTLAGGLSWIDCSSEVRQEWGFLKKKCRVCEGIEEELASCSSRQVPQGSRMLKVGKGHGYSQVQEGHSDHWPLWLASDVYCARWGRVFMKPQAIKQVWTWAVQWVGKLT